MIASTGFVITDGSPHLLGHLMLLKGHRPCDSDPSALGTGPAASSIRSLTTVGGLEANTIADGLFHTATWLLVVVGLYMLWDRSRDVGGVRSSTELTGLLLAGWGAFNLVEGVIDHQILGIHHLPDDEGAPIGWDLGFLAFGAALVVLGVLLARRGARERSASAG